VLPLKLASPLYCAVIEKLPAWVNVALNVAVPAADSGLVPIVIVPFRNVTVPVGVPAPGATTVTVAVKLTLCPTADGFGDEVTLVLVLALFTTCETAALVLVLKLALPRYVAVIEWVATDNAPVLNVHVKGAAAGNVQLPITVAPSRKLTVPAGLPAPGATTATVAVKVTD